MSSKVPPVPHKAPLLEDNGLLTGIWADWFKQILFRMGGSISSTNNELASVTTGLLKIALANGYTKLPNGIILQWGVTGSIASGVTTSPTFPILFPTACLQVLPCIRDNSAVATTATGQFGSGNYSVSGFDLYNRTSVSQTFNWLAVGY